MNMFNIDSLTHLDGWCSKEKMIKLYDLIIKTNPSIVVEIGVFGGKSLFPQAFALKNNCHGKIIGIDPWEKNSSIEHMDNEISIKWWSELDYQKLFNACNNFILRHQLDEYVELFRGKSLQFIQTVDSTFLIDILHIDGNHEEPSSCMDVDMFLPFVKPGGYVWMDDANWFQTQSAIKLLTEKYGCSLIESVISKESHCNLYLKNA